ncbi:hypothetical protein [Clostridium sp. BL-8]|uniref:hypothetical protein n=1 Tax=Clostridium sp. BL-8 TaxID=349938 RepID=UPI00098C4830|nr:hypothetical protein [Clostridium sp. BL-8]OOM79968.1 hypothetical protein CLOBL_13360 [Clostridium sp. BL-8]
MRKHVQKWILDLFPTIVEGINYVINSETEQASARGVLQDCYAALEAIEKALIEGLSKERYSYYENTINEPKNILEELNMNIINEKSTAGIFEQITKQISILQKEITREAEVKLEVVFMPYKASMWDSLESIWKAANEDSNCECYVIPIPYYVRNADVNKIEFCYEGDKFPEDISITHYNDYNLSAHKPDIIYIHNPYDDCNYVTSVHPNYYSSELKKYTDMLVYVPYYITGSNIQESQINLPVFQNMDKMIVQSEKHKEFYKSIIPEDKLAVLGSPKVDRVLYYEKHKHNISNEWGKIIGNKKVVMYNVSISGILEDRIKAIKKMEYVFSIFKERKDVVLLWRPHPLIESTLKSMLPDLVEEYITLKEKFIDENIGIYDDNADVTESIAICDAYIGEGSSSMVHLFGVAGKPIFILNTEIDRKLTEEDRTSLSFFDAYFENDNMWFVCSGLNVLCKMDLKTEKVEVIKKISSNTNPEMIQYCDVMKIENKIYMLPYFSSDMCEYDLEKDILKKKSIPDAAIVNFDRIIRYKDSLFMKPKNYQAIVQYNINSAEYKYHNECIKEFEKISDGKPMFMWGVCVRDNLLLMASSIANKVLEFNMDTWESQVHTVGSEEMNYFGMAFDGKDYWLIPEDGKTIIRWNYETGETREYNNYPPNFKGETRLFRGIVWCGEYMLAFPREANMILEINISTGNMSEYKIKLPYKEGERDICNNMTDTNYYFAKKYDDKYVVALTAYDNSLLIINTETQEFSIKKCRLRLDEVKKYLNTVEQFGEQGENIPYASNESKYFYLEEFIEEYVKLENKNNSEIQKKNYFNNINNMDGTCGEKVHDYIKGAIV